MKLVIDFDADYHPDSTAGRAFFVVWSLLAVPSLTILISNMGDTFVKWFSDFTLCVGSITVLPGEKGVRATFKSVLENIITTLRQSVQRFTPPGIFGDAFTGHTMQHEKRMSSDEHEKLMMDRLADRLTTHIEQEELQQAHEAEVQGDELDVSHQHLFRSDLRDLRDRRETFTSITTYSPARSEIYRRISAPAHPQNTVGRNGSTS
jgi:potassium channel subfamily K, other eukaryote